MADCSNSTETEVIYYQSQSPPPELDCDKKNAIDQFFEDTEPLDDAVALHSSFDGTPLVTLDFDTQVVVEDVRQPQQITEYEMDVVLDSEDEGNSDVKGDRRIEGNVVGSQRGQLRPPFPHFDDFQEAFDGSIAGEHCGTEAGKNHPQMSTNDQVFTELYYIGSEEPTEASQENALDFVNHYLSLNNVDSSTGTKPRNFVRKIVSPVSRIKGCQSLAKQIKTMTPVGKDGTFEWVDNDHCEGIDLFSKRTATTLGLGGSQQKAVKRHRKVDHVGSKESSSSCNKSEEKHIELNKEVTATSYSDSMPPADSAKEMMNFENDSVKNSNELLREVQLGWDSNTYTTEEKTPDMFDVGFGTQMAAEAMEALSYGLPTDSCVGNVIQHPLNPLLDSSPGLTKRKTHLKEPCLHKGAKSKTEMSKRRESNASSSRRHSCKQELDNGLEIMIRRKRTKSFVGRLNGMNKMYQNEISARKSAKPVKKRKEEGVMGKESTKECENQGSLSIPIENSSLDKPCMHTEPVTHQRITECKLEEKKDGPDNLGDRTNDLVKGIIVTYKRKRSSLGAKPSQVLNARGKCTEAKPFTNQRPGMTGGELEGTKDEPDSTGERINVVTKGSIITYKRKRSAKVFEVMKTEGQCSKLCCNTTEVLRNNKPTEQKQGSLEVFSLTRSLNFNAWSCPKGKRMPRRRPSYLNEVNNLSTPFMIVDRREGYQKPYNKSLPKSSLLKQLIRVGIQEPKPDFTWKDLRKRRDMSHVQVLFSQHLDEDVIKQQKKIMSRLGISIASCSKNATHFIADKFVRTRNMLEAIAFGKSVVTHLWLESCGQASCLIDEKNYILRDAKKEREIGFSMPASLSRASQHPLLKGRRVFITPNIKPDVEMITSLTKAVHGQVVEKIQKSGLKITDDLLILSCEEDHSICVPFLDIGAPVHSSELLLNGIVIQKLEYERHQLFTNGARRKRRPRTR